MSNVQGYSGGGQRRVTIPGVGRDVENVLLWRDVRVSGGAFVALTLLYILLEWSGLTLLTIFSNTLLALISIAFIWNNVANFTGKQGVPLPYFVRNGVSEGQLKQVAEGFTSIINKGLSFLDRLISGKDVILTVEVAAGLYVFGKIGNFFSSLGLLYTLVVLAFSVPKIYELKKDDIDQAVSSASSQGKTTYKNYVEPYVNKIPRASNAQGTSSSTTSSYQPNQTGNNVTSGHGSGGTGTGVNQSGGGGGGDYQGSGQGGADRNYQGSGQGVGQGGGDRNYQSSGQGAGQGGAERNYQGSGQGVGQGGGDRNYQGSGQGGGDRSYQGGGQGGPTGGGPAGGNYQSSGAGAGDFPNAGRDGGNFNSGAGNFPSGNRQGGGSNFDSEVDQFTPVGRNEISGVNSEGKKY